MNNFYASDRSFLKLAVMTRHVSTFLLITLCLVSRAAADVLPNAAAKTKQTSVEKNSELLLWTPDAKQASNLVSGEQLLKRIQFLASDKTEGRAPGTPGEDLTVDYLIHEFQTIGLQPGNPDGTYIQKVPLIGATAKYEASFKKDAEVTKLVPNQDIVAVSHRLVPQVNLKDSKMVFVGYGVVAPEYGWDDYKGVDLHGKTAVMFIGDPPVVDPANPKQLDPKMFNGKAMTYYGRWTYKYEMAAKMGAEAAIIIHETEGVGYPFEVLISSNAHENFDIKAADQNRTRSAINAWVSLDEAKKLLKDSGQDFDHLKSAALQKSFQPIELKTLFSIDLKRTEREVQSRNVVAILPGSEGAKPNDSAKKNFVIYSAHWDHLGRDKSLRGDQIFNGALDNASGVSSVLEIARTYKNLKSPPKASIVFLIPTCEEKGLLGSEYYASHPLYPLDQTRANINIDGVNVWGRTRDVAIVGFGNSNLDEVLKASAQTQGRTVVPEPEPEKGMFYRSDHFNFAKVGVPSIMTRAGFNYIGKPAGYGQKKHADYTAHDYHKVSDEVKSDWDFTSAAEDTRLWFQLGYRVAQNPVWPEWAAKNEFKSIRDASLRKTEASPK